MKKGRKIRGVTGIFVLPCIMLCSGGGDEVLTDGSAHGHLYCGNGQAADRVIVEAVPAGSVPVRIAGIDSSSDSLPAAYFSQTDTEGGYEFPSLPKGTYNFYSTRDSLHAMLERVAIAGEVELPNDTLKPPGRIEGVVRLAGGEDCRAVLIMAVGADANLVATPRDTGGSFTLKNLAEGEYRIRFMSMYQYPVLDTDFSVVSGKATDAGTIVLKGKP